ncbi:MAG: phosphoribosylglycinamide formyltransferase [Pirellulales bacterium]
MSDAHQRPPLPVAMLISGGGTTLKNLLDRRAAGELNVDFRLLISSNAKSQGLQIAAAAGVPTLVIERGGSDSADAYSEAMFGPIRAAGAELVVMGGFLKLLPIPPDYENRVINIHPSLIPSFCGAGYYKERVHQAVLDHGAKITGCTVHFVDNQYDHGPIILQKAVAVEEGDTVESLQKRVFAAECEALPEAIHLFHAGRLHVEDRRVVVS